MSLTDPISNLITNIKNAVHAKKETLEVPASKLSQKILEICKNDGYIEDFRLLKDNKQGILKVYLRYEKVPRVLNGLGMAVISTSRGIMTDKEARKHKIGGEIICYIW